MQHPYETALPTSSVFQIVDSSLMHTDIIFWNARCIKSKECKFVNYLILIRQGFKHSEILILPSPVTYGSDSYPTEYQ
jgi:hypothetical protein